MSPKKAAKLVEKAIQSARANAINNHGLEPERLRVGERPRSPEVAACWQVAMAGGLQH